MTRTTLTQKTRKTNLLVAGRGPDDPDVQGLARFQFIQHAVVPLRLGFEDLPAQYHRHDR